MNFTWSLICFITALVAAVFGFGGILETRMAAEICRMAFFVFLIAFVVTLIGGWALCFLGFHRRYMEYPGDHSYMPAFACRRPGCYWYKSELRKSTDNRTSQ
jgi:uncharacterized membrane protein YtjA (UPF0391 family)